MVNPNRIAHDTPELRDVLLGFLESASSLCDMMNTTMAAVLNGIMSIQVCLVKPQFRECARISFGSVHETFAGLRTDPPTLTATS